MGKRDRMHSSHENLSPQVIMRVGREIQQLAKKPLDGIKYIPLNEDSIGEIHAEIAGPVGTPYEGGHFRMKLVLTEGFPQSPPKGYFLTKIYHPNISANGDICVNTLKRDWNAELGIQHVLQVIRCLLIVPFPESSLNDEAGKLFMDSYEEYSRRAKLMTGVHAMKSAAVDSSADQENDASGNGGGGAAGKGPGTPKGVLKEQEKKKMKKKKSLKRL